MGYRESMDSAHELRVTVTGCTRPVQAQAKLKSGGGGGFQVLPSLRSYLHLTGERESPF